MTQMKPKIATIFFCLWAVSGTLIIFTIVRNRLNGDITKDLLTWFGKFTQQGLKAISGAYSVYPPTYLYLLAAVAPLYPLISDVVLIKSVSVAFTFVAAFIVYLMVLEITMNQRISAMAGAGLLVLP